METKYCPSCFRQLTGSGDNRLCPVCGFDLAANPQPQNALPWYTLLHDRYRVGRVLGQGGFGITYIGFDTNLQCKVAIKEYYPQGVVVRDASQSHSLTWPASQSAQGKENGCESFLREARKMARIGSIPGIVRVIDTFTENDTSYIIMDYLEGVTLRQYIRANGPMSFERCLNMLRPLFGAVDQMHAKGMIHRDISPDNIMVRGDGSVWLLDFGAAKDIEVNMGTESSAVVAKKGFSPSEQYSGKNIGPWTDVYALCATMYYCVSGRTLPDISERIQDDSIRWEPVQVSENIRETIREGLSMRYSDRIQSISELIDRLDDNEGGGSGLQKDSVGTQGGRTGNETEVVADTGSDGGYSVYIGSIAEETAKQKRKGLVKIAAAAAAVLLLVCAAVFAGFRLGSSSTAAEEPEESETVESTNAVDTAQESDDAGEDAQGDDESGPPEEDAEPGGTEGQEAPEASAPQPASSQAPAPAQQSTPAPQAETYVTNRSLTTSSGNTYSYTGEVSNGKPNGKGTATYSNGATYTGDWKDGVQDGTGTWTYADGGKSEGEFKNGSMNGQGTMTTSSGHKYVGEFKEGKIYTGTYSYPGNNGYNFVSEYKNGDIVKMTGTSPNGSTTVTEYKNGSVVKSTTTDPDGKIFIREHKNGEITMTTIYPDGRIFIDGEFVTN